jgi:hypothetical protein
LIFVQYSAIERIIPVARSAPILILGRGIKFAYKLIFNPLKNIFIDPLRVLVLYTEIKMGPFLKIIKILGINNWHIIIFVFQFRFPFKKSVG